MDDTNNAFDRAREPTQPDAHAPRAEGRSTDRLDITELASRDSLTRDHATLWMLDGPTAGAAHALDAQRPTIIGRANDCHVAVADPGVSRRHAQIVRDGAIFLLQDLGSTNGTWVGGARVRGRRPLASGDVIRVGRAVRFRFDIHSAREQGLLSTLYESSVRDPLTGLFNRRYLEQRLPGEVGCAARHGHPLSVLMLDIDGFKDVNDRHGHAAGDRVLCRVGATMRSMLRGADMVCRYGGDELCVVARSLHGGNGAVLADRIRSTLAALTVRCDGAEVRSSASIGVATFDPATDSQHDAEQLIRRADRALYEAKRAGRNCVRVFTRGRSPRGGPARGRQGRRPDGCGRSGPVEDRATRAATSTRADR